MASREFRSAARSDTRHRFSSPCIYTFHRHRQEGRKNGKKMIGKKMDSTTWPDEMFFGRSGVPMAGINRLIFLPFIFLPFSLRVGERPVIGRSMCPSKTAAGNSRGSGERR